MGLPPTCLLCKPTYFEVTYRINPWMRPREWHTDSEHFHATAVAGWNSMYETFTSLGAHIELMEPQPGLPDMVFPANAAVVLNGKALLSRFKFEERQGEEVHIKKRFTELLQAGVIQEVASLPEEITQEGAGDCVWDQKRQLFWAGYGPRSDEESLQYISEFFGIETIPLELVTNEFYHADVSICPLSGGEVMYYPGAFSKTSCSDIKEQVGSDLAIPVGDDDANFFALNAVNLGSKVILAECSRKLERQLHERGYEVVKVPVSIFNMAGGSVWCMVLRLDLKSD